MTKAEARKHFVTSYLYWHGSQHCWDASSGRRPITRNIQSNTEAIPREDREPKWHQARSLGLPSDAAPSAQSQPSENYGAPSETSVGTLWSDRWADLVQEARGLDAQASYAMPSVVMPSMKATGRRSVPVIAAGGLILILLSVLLIVAFAEFLRRRVSL